MTITINGSGTITGATTLASTVASPTMTTPTLTTPTMTGAIVSAMGSSVITSGTAVASTSGTSIDFTGIPSWAKRVTVIFAGVSTNGSSNVQVQIGSGSVTTTGYSSTSALIFGTNQTLVLTSTSGFTTYQNAAGDVRSGTIVLTNITGNTWVACGLLNSTVGDYSANVAGYIALSGTLDRVRITSVNGTDTFDAGTANILYE